VSKNLLSAAIIRSSVMGSFCSTPALPADEEVFESVVCDVSDLPEGAPKQFKLDGNKPCLVVKHKGEIHAVSDRCTHYGASLANGAFADGVVRCPFHGACFNVESGDIEDFPGLDSLQKFEVQVDAGKVKIRAKKSQLDSLKRVKPMAKRDASNAEEVVIVGGGAAAEVRTIAILTHSTYVHNHTLKVLCDGVR
jgi:nitrite reductase/ring-hydroxylating ferredoxin subunit